MAIKYNPYEWEIRPMKKDTIEKKDFVVRFNIEEGFKKRILESSTIEVRIK